MSRNTTDELRQEIEFRLQMADIDVVPVEAINSIIDLISNREKLARIEEVGFAYDLMQGLLLENDDSDFVCTEFQRQARSRMSELSTLRKELDRED